MDTVLVHLEAFIGAVKDDPSSTDTFRDAAGELHAHLVAAESKPKRASKPKATAEPVEG